jgi:tetratricopeptide (TPR) repeat protein
MFRLQLWSDSALRAQMTTPTNFEYRAFLSYSHADMPLAKWLHSHLESFSLRGLAGLPTSVGPVPRSLQPIFRDRDDFSAGVSLNDQTMAALDASAALIVLCSPASARSRYVNELIRLYKHRWPERRIVPVIVTGKSQDAAQECFPPALKFELDAEGKITDRVAATSIAAEVHGDWGGDGRELALAKVVAALIGRPADEVFKRGQHASKRQAFIRDAVAAGVLVLAAVAGYFAHRPQKQSLVTAGVAASCASHLPAGRAVEGSQSAQEQCGEAQEAFPKGDAADPREAESVRSINQGKPEEAEHLQVEAARAAPAAERLASQERQHDLSVSHEEADSREKSGDALLDKGALADALKTYRDGLAIREGLAKADSANVQWQRDLSVSYNKVGDVLADQGVLPDALKAYRDSLAIAERIAKTDPANSEWQRDLFVISNKVGDVVLAQGELADALRAYRDSLAIAERLAETDPANVKWQRDRFVAYNKVGDVLLAQGAPADALAAYRNGLAIADRLAKADPSNTQWQRDLSVFSNKVGDVLVDQGALDDALKAYRDGLTIRERLVKTDPANAGSLVDLAASYGKLGQLLVRMGDKAEAQRMFVRGKAIVAPFAQKSGHQLWIGYLKAFDENLAALEN